MSGGIRAVLFDLDGTLLEVDVEAFFADYLQALTDWIGPYLDPRDFSARLHRATRVMTAARDGRLTNKEAFEADFFSGIEDSRDRLLEVFEAFYRDVFPRFETHASPVPGARAAVEAAMAGGRKTAVATSPLFPLAAIRERLRWAGLQDLPFDLVTSYENMHHAKPHAEYYAEIARRLAVPPAECLMVGNDVEEDLVAQDLGMLTFLVGPRIIHRKQRPATPDFRGVIADLPALLDGRLPRAPRPGG